MLTPRRVIVAAVVIVVLSIMAGVVSLLGPPDSSGLASDSYGTRRSGQRGLYETLIELGVPAERSVRPPGENLPVESTVVLWGPDPDIVATEPRHLQRLRRWVERGGRAVLAPSRKFSFYRSLAARDEELTSFDVSIWDVFEIDDLSTRQLSESDLPLPAGAQESAAEPESYLMEALGKMAVEARRKTVVETDCEGELERLGTLVGAVGVPVDELVVLAPGRTRPDGRVAFTDESGARRTLVACYNVGEGQIVVVSDPVLFNNSLLATEDNAVLAVHLLAGEGRRPVFDEFYHGLSVRGNPLWLLTRPEYAMITIAVVLVVGVATWRSGLLLGPPLTTAEASRRAVGEYVDAMSRFFHRGRKTRRFLLEGVYSGVVWKIAREHGLRAGTGEVDQIAAVLARRDPQRARQLRESAANVDAVLKKRDNCREREALEAMADVGDCL